MATSAEAPWARYDGWPFVSDDRPSKIVSVGKNYARHAAEMASQVPDVPLLFLKPPSSLLPDGAPIRIPAGIGAVHHEVELGVVIGRRIHRATSHEAPSAIRAWCLAIDLTARDMQQKAKAAGAPWTIAKGFDGFCPVSRPVPATDVDPRTATLELDVDGDPRQAGRTSDMVWSVPELIGYISHIMTLEPGDLILTGTPEGVGPLVPGNEVEARLDGRVMLRHTVEKWE